MQSRPTMKMGLFSFSKICLLAVSLFVHGTSSVLWGSFNSDRPQHGVSGNIRLLNSKTILLENFSYDGRGVRVFVYYYRPGVSVVSTGGGFNIPVPGGNADGSFVNGRRYTRENVTLTLPEGTDACDISTITIWCQPFTVFFNRGLVRRDVFENNGADPCTLPPENIEVPLTTPAPPEFDNCRFLHESLQMRWRVNRDESNVRFQLCGCLSSNPNVDQYMGFGLSGSTSSTLMFGADPTITWVDTNSQPNAVDYHLSAYSQCVVSVGQGACPDTVDSRGTCTNDATVVGGFRDDSQQCVTFTRPFTPSDVGTCDQALNPDNQNQYIVWGVGGLGETAFRHFTRAQATDTPLHLGRASLDECGDTSLTCQICPPYVGQQIIALEDTTFRAVIGPSGNERGYMGITGQAGWGIAWFINGSLIPELVVQRGRNYTFIVEGGDTPNSLSVYHPFYITDSITGGRLRASNDTRVNENVYAGFDGDRETAFGRLCELDETPEALASRTSCQNLTDYQDRLIETSRCSQGQPGQLTWTPDADTPNLVYYQCATHLNLGWRIRVMDPPTTTMPPPPDTTEPPTVDTVGTTGPSTNTPGTEVNTPTEPLQTTTTDVTQTEWGSFLNPPPQHGVLGSVRLLNSKTIRLENFSYDGRGVAVFVYYYRPGVTVTSSGGGVIIPVPGGNADGSFVNGRRYTLENVTLTLPEGTDACDISTITIWCQPFRVFFNRALLRRDVFENNGADPCTVLPENIVVPLTTPAPPEFDNCRFLHESLQMRWRVNRAESNVRFQLCGCLSSNPNVDQYMGFGLSGSSSSTLMFGADPTITWVGTNSQPNAVDYHLSGYSQCIVTVGEGACPDTVDSRGTCTNDATVVGGFRDDSQQCVTFTRPFTPSDVGTCDQALNPDNQNQYIVWGVGGLGETAFRHFTRAQATDTPLHLGRASLDECGDTSLTCQICPPYVGQQIIALEDTTFRAVIGPSGNERGYMGITGQAGWGIAWFINGSLIPELVVQRGRNYTFIVEGGDTPNALSVYHPFYITDSITGGRLRASNDTRASEIVYAGFAGDDPTAFGRLCELDETPEALASRTSCQNLTDYQDRLVETSSCSQGQPGQLTWTPDADTPNLVYYQCATHLNLGWRIRVMDPPTTTMPPPTVDTVDTPPPDTTEPPTVVTVDTPPPDTTEPPTVDTVDTPPPDTTEPPTVDTVDTPPPDTTEPPTVDTVDTPPPDTTEPPTVDTVDTPPPDTTEPPTVDTVDTPPPDTTEPPTVDTVDTPPPDTTEPPTVDTVDTPPPDTTEPPTVDTVDTPPPDTTEPPTVGTIRTAGPSTNTQGTEVNTPTEPLQTTTTDDTQTEGRGQAVQLLASSLSVLLLVGTAWILIY